MNTQSTEISKQKGILLSQTGVCFLILVFSASKKAFYFIKLGFAFSFWCFPQVKRPFTLSNWGLLSHFGVFRK
jgi:hypothetical protein